MIGGLRNILSKASLYKWWILGVVVVVVGLMLVRMMFSSSEGFTSDQPASLVLFYSNNCGHCQEFLPKWKEMAQTHGGSTDVKTESDLKPTGDGVQLKEVNCDAHGDIATNHQIEGVPTMILFKGGDSHVYGGPRNEEAIKAFVESGGQVAGQ